MKTGRSPEAVAAQVQLAVGTVVAIREARSGNVEQAPSWIAQMAEQASTAPAALSQAVRSAHDEARTVIDGE